jgi:hypothetical protein
VLLSRPLFQAVDPVTGEKGRRYDGQTVEEALAIAGDVRSVWQGWRGTRFAERSRLMRAAAEVLRRRKDEFAELMTSEMGKTVTEGRAEIEKCAFNCDWFAEHAEGFLAREPVDMGEDGKPVPAPSSPTSPSAWCWRSCRGTSLSGRSSASPRRPDGGERRRPEARLQRPWLCARNRSGVPRGRVPGDLFRTLLIP